MPSTSETRTLVVQCAWCRRMQTGEHQGKTQPLAAGETHGICPACRIYFEEEYRQRQRRQQLTTATA